MGVDQGDCIERTPRRAWHRGSIAQAQLWRAHRAAPDPAALAVSAAIRLSGPLDTKRFMRAWEGLLARHEALRTRFEEVGGQLRQIVDEAPNSELVVDPHRARVERATVDTLRDLARADGSRGPSLRQPLRARLAHLGSDEHALLLALHPMIVDCISVGVLLDDLAELYGAERAGVTASLPELPIQYLDFGEWQRREIDGALAPQLAYWREAARSMPSTPDGALLPRPAVRRKLTIPKALVDAVAARVRSHGATFHVAVLGVFGAVLAHCLETDQVVIGAAVAARTRRELARIVGPVANLLPLRIELDPSASATDFCRAVRRTVLAAFSRQEVPCALVAPVPRFVLAVTEPPAASSLFDGLRAEAIDVDAGSTIYDLSLTLEHGDDAVGLVLTEGDPQLTAAATRIEATLPAVLEAIAADPSRPMGEILSTVRSGARSQAGHRGAVNPDERRDTLRPPELARRPARPPHTSTELSLAEIWHGVLGQPVADAHADFFELGGESLEALRMIVLIHERFAVRVPLVSLLETASLASLACEIDGLLERRPSSDRTTS